MLSVSCCDTSKWQAGRVGILGPDHQAVGHHQIFKPSRWLGDTLNSRLKFRKFEKEIETSEQVNMLKFSADGRYLLTDLGLIEVLQSIDLGSFDELCVRKQSICYGAAPVFHLPPDFQPQCYDVKGNQVAIGFQNGRVLIFDFDCRSLHSVLGQT